MIGNCVSYDSALSYMEAGAAAIYLIGNIGDRWTFDNRMDLIDKFITCVKKTGVPAGVYAALGSLRTMGRYVQGGILHKEVPLDLDDIFFGREITMFGSHTHKPSSWATTMRLLGERKVDPSPLISKVLPLEEWEKGFRMVRDKEAVKVILEP